MTDSGEEGDISAEEKEETDKEKDLANIKEEPTEVKEQKEDQAEVKQDLAEDDQTTEETKEELSAVVKEKRVDGEEKSVELVVKEAVQVGETKVDETGAVLEQKKEQDSEKPKNEQKVGEQNGNIKGETAEEKIVESEKPEGKVTKEEKRELKNTEAETAEAETTEGEKPEGETTEDEKAGDYVKEEVGEQTTEPAVEGETTEDEQTEDKETAEGEITDVHEEELPDEGKKAKRHSKRSAKSRGSTRSSTKSYRSSNEETEEEEDYDEKVEGEYIEEEEGEEEEPEFYDPDDFLSGPMISTYGTLPLNILEFFHSFGYNCRKKFNLEVLDEDTIVFASGNFLHFFNLETREIWFRRSANGQGIGHIKKNPNPEYPHFAVAECGDKPIIILYNWPEMTILCILRGGAKKLYSNMDYSPDGEFLVSQSGEPDYMITVWNWHEHKILLRNKSYINDVYRVKFSPYIPGQITTSGVAHIKFWKMANTFTGLKLQGEVGRFGKTEYSDILGVYAMPDEKVVSGCSWGNILIWDGGLITLEVFRTLRKTCHDAPIVQIYYEEGELWTVSLDGHVRIWWYEKIDQADPPDDDRVILLDPSYDFYTPGTSLYLVVKRRAEGSMFVAQDGNGGIWQIDLNTLTEPEPSIQFYKCHAGKVVDIACYGNGSYLASLGKDGRIYVYNYLNKKMVFTYEFPAKGARMLWPDTDCVPSGDVILAGFCDGQIRVCVINLKQEEHITLTVTQVIKPHNKAITHLVMNATSDVLVSGSEDSTIFVFAVNTINEMANFLVPIGFIPAPDSVTYLTWKPKHNYTILVGCLHGQLMEVEVPREPQKYTEVSYLLEAKPKYQNFTTYKSQIRRDIYLRKVARRKAKKVAVKRKEMERILKDNPGLEIDEEVFLADSESEEELEPLHIPEVKNGILWMRYTPDQTVWLSMGGYDAGYIYEYKMDQTEEIPFRFKMVYEADDTEISSYLFDEQRKYLFFAMQDGTIRINRVNPKNFRDLTDYWTYALHDNQYGFVPRMRFSYDEKFFFTCGHDGNVFAMAFNHENYMPNLTLRPLPRTSAVFNAKDVDSYTKLSLEGTKIKAEQDRIMKAANAHKTHVREVLKDLKQRYVKLLARNYKLLPSQIIPRDKLELDRRVLDHIDESFHSKLDLVKRKLAYDLEKSNVQMTKLLKYFTDPCDMHPVKITGINNPAIYLLTVRQRVMSPMFAQVLKMCEDKIEEDKNKGRAPERVQVAVKPPTSKTVKQMALEYFLLSLTPSQIQNKLGPKLTRLLKKYRGRREKWEKRAEEWEEFNIRKPNPNTNHPDDEKFLQEAASNIGDYKLKEADDYKPLHEERETTVKKYKQVLDTRLKQYNLRHSFIQKVYEIRDLKYQTRDRLLKYKQYLTDIQAELPTPLHQFGPDVPDVNPDEFPEEKLKPHIILEETEAESIDSAVIQEHVHIPSVAQRERQLLPHRTSYPKMNNDNVFIPFYPSTEIAKVIDAECDDLVNNYPDDVDTPFESELRAKRFTRKLFLQSVTISNMNREIEEFNYEVEEAKKARLPVHPSGNFVDIYILTLNQELNILKSFEDGEDYLQNKVNKSLQHLHSMEDDIDVEKSKKVDIESEIELNHGEELKVQEKFKHVTESNKFYDFLRKVFRKKYRPPKLTTDSDSDSESSSSSSEESEEDDGASIDSRDFGFIKQDLNVCPKGCEQAIFNLTVELRGNRHQIEQNVKELQRVIETINKNIELGNRKLRILQNQYQQSVNELEAYQREKQRLLNQVRCTVVLNLDQLHDYNPETDEISDYLVFSSLTLSNLYKRVGGLEYENLQQKAKYETYLKHLTRMKKDLRYMRAKIKSLMQTIQQMMVEKFGKVVDINELELAMIKKTFNKSHINELEEVVLKKLVFDVRVKNTNIKDIYAAQLNEITRTIRKSQDDLIVIIKENTNRLELLQVMNKEKKELVKTIASQPKRRGKLDKAIHSCAEYEKDVKKLEAIVETQNRTMFDLKSEIKMLKTKGMPPKEQYVEPKITEELEMEEQMKEWPDIEKYLEAAYEEAAEERQYQEIEMPGFYLTETEDIVTSLLNEILSTMKMKSRTTIDGELIVRSILSHIINCTSVQEIIKQIIDNIPFELTAKQRSLVETSAEKLLLIQEPDMSEDSIIKYARELLEDTIDETLQQKDAPYEVVIHLLEKLVESIPKEFLFHESSLESVAVRIGSYISGQGMSRESWERMVMGIKGAYKNEMLEILNIILKRVYETGLDYLYVIKDQ